MVSGRGGDEITAFIRQQSGDRLRILPPQRLAGENNDAGVDFLGLEAGGLIGAVDDGAERCLVDALVARIGRERDRRLEQGLSRDDIVTAGEIFSIAPQIDAGEDDLSARGSDVDADRHQRDVVLDPDRILLQRTLVAELEMIVIVIGIAIVIVHEVLTEQVIGEGVALLVVRTGHRDLISLRRRDAWPRHLMARYGTANSARSKAGATHASPLGQTLRAS